jgi:hypothetical protein
MERHDGGYARGSGLNSWSTTFADILTLVLSFFIATISVSPLNPASESASERQISTVSNEVGVLEPQTSVDEEGGTRLAATTPEAPPRNPTGVIEFGASDFGGGGAELSGEARERLRSVVMTDAYRPLSVRIESCDGAGDENLGRERGLTLRRQIFDVAGRGPTVRLAVMDGDCRSIPGLPVGGTARITVRRAE